ncbi:MAG: hypothetical protein ACRDX9_13125 [Acidimicrobiia bacterium]
MRCASRASAVADMKSPAKMAWVSTAATTTYSEPVRTRLGADRCGAV